MALERTEETTCRIRRPSESEHVGLMEASILNHDKERQRWTSVGPVQWFSGWQGKPSNDTATVFRKTEE